MRVVGRVRAPAGSDAVTQHIELHMVRFHLLLKSCGQLTQNIDQAIGLSHSEARFSCNAFTLNESQSKG